MMYNNPYMYGGAGSGMNFGTNPYFAPYMQNQMFQQQAQAQPQQQPQVQPQAQQPTTINTNKIYVNGINDVKTKYQPANSDIFYFDNDNPSIIYEKIVDGTGHFDVRTFSVAEERAPESQNSAETKNLSTYAKTTDLEPLRAEIKDLKEKITKLDIKAELNSLNKKEGK